jgi:hypothetical protein
MGGACSIYGNDEINEKIFVGQTEWRDHLEGNIEINLKEILQVDVNWIYLAQDMCSRGGLLWTRWWIFKLHKMREIFGMAEELLASQEGFCFMELLTVASLDPNVSYSGRLHDAAM